jgi:transketolase
MHRAVRAAAEHVGPVYLRSSRVAMPYVYPEDGCPFEIGKANVVRTGRDVTIVACGIMVAAALDAAVVLAQEGIEARVLDMHTLRPMDSEALAAAARETGAIVTAEEHTVIGGLGGAVAEALGELAPVPMERVGIRDTFARTAPDPETLMDAYGLGVEDVVAAAHRVLARKK